MSVRPQNHCEKIEFYSPETHEFHLQRHWITRFSNNFLGVVGIPDLAATASESLGCSAPPECETGHRLTPSVAQFKGTDLSN